MKTLRSVLILAALAAVPVAGCGGSDDESTDTTATLSKAKFLALGNAICATAERGLAKLKSDPGSLATENGSQSAFAKADKLSKDYGLGACAG